MTFFELANVALDAAQQPLLLIIAFCAALFINSHTVRVLLLAAVALAPAALGGLSLEAALPVFAAALAVCYGVYLVRFLLSPPGSTPGRRKKKPYKVRRYA